MKHINSIAINGMKKIGNIGCGECQSSCQSACQSELQEQRRKSQHRQKAVAVRG